MSGDLTREEVTSRLGEIFSSSLEGDELEKALGSIEKRLDKFEGKWAGLIKWAEQKYGQPEEVNENPTDKEEKAPDSPEETQEIIEDAGESGEISRDEAHSRLESIFRANLEGEELEKMIGSIEKRLDKFEGKWPKLILWAEEKFGPETESDAPEQDSAPAPAPEPEKSRAEETLELIVAGDNEEALKNLKLMISQTPNDSDSWVVASSYFSSIGFSGRAKACEEKAG